MGQKVNHELIQEVSRLVSQLTGVQLGANQTSMVQFRLAKRMLELGMVEPSEYLAHLRANVNVEARALISLLTTHHTFFFREFNHFEYLEREALPKLVEALRKQGRTTLRVWSAACSRGQEVYSLSMFLSVHLKKIAPEMTYEIFGSDVDEESVAISKNGVYRWDEVKEIPSVYLLNNWARGTGEIADFVKAKPSIKQPCRFGVVNLIDLPLGGLPEKFDIIMVRNVFIYFKPEQIKMITARMLKSLESHGHFIIGLSEHLNNLNLPVVSVGPSVFQHKSAVVAEAKVQKLATPPPATTVSASKAIRVFCVDDSSTVLTLLRKIFSGPGYEVVGTAINGLDAAEKLKTVTADVVTLDIHMPKQNGVEYLEKNMSSKHPPVVVISSVSREDANLGIRALELGAKDYVEKPSLADLAEKGDEIRMKVKCAVQSAAALAPTTDIEKAFERKFEVKDAGSKLRVIVGGFGDRDKIKLILRDSDSPQPATLILIHGSDKLLPAFGIELEKGFFRPVNVIEAMPDKWEQDKVYLADVKKLFAPLRRIDSSAIKEIVCAVLGECSKSIAEELREWTRVQILVEDIAGGSEVHARLKSIARFHVPATSMVYHMNQLLSGESI